MSFIDVFGHEYVASFARLPVYHPLQRITGEFEAGPDTLLLGGGSGEHPALIVRHLDHVAGYYVAEMLERVDAEHLADQSEILDNPVSPFECLEFTHWGVADYAVFFEACKSAAMPHEPFNPKEHGGFESWLVKQFGALIFRSMPDLAPALTADMKAAAERVADTWEAGSNFVCAPPGFNAPRGRRVNGQLNEGLSAWTRPERNLP
jgi:hypothetical protein